MLSPRRSKCVAWGSPRRALLLVAAIALPLCGVATPVSAAYEVAKARFDRLDNDTKISIGISLIATGDFDGLLDFGFTKRFYKALTAFQAREGFVPDGELSASELARLKQRAAAFYTSLGLRYYTHPSVPSKVLVPRSMFDTERPTPRGFAFERNDASLSMSFVAYPASEKTFTQLYDSLTQPTPRRKVIYKKLRSNYFVANGVYRGRYYYTWMSDVGSGTTGFTITWSPAVGALGSRLAILLANSFVSDGIYREAALPPSPLPPSTRSVPVPEEPPRTSGTGTGFKVTYEGHLLTNFHVAGHCQKIMVRKPGELPIPAALVAGDETNDLAFIKTLQSLNGTVATFSGASGTRAGSEIAVFGFPLAGALASSGNIVTGNITALAGLGNDSRYFQISAPVQPGNSGGPVMDRRGLVVAVVVSKLNAIATANLTGDIPQNVNFAIKGSVATSFLEGVGVNFMKSDAPETIDTPGVAERAQRFTFLIECQN
jgi:serine protease Do